MGDDEAERTISRESESDDRAAGDDEAVTEPRSAVEDSTDADGTATADDRAVDDAADSFVSLELELQELDGGPERLTGVAADVERIPAAAVPDGYPLAITTQDAVRVRVRTGAGALGLDDAVDDSREAIYLEWPPSEDGPLSRLLALRDVDPEQFADLHGERVPLAVEDGFLVPRLPPAGPRGSANGVYGILAGLVGNLGVLALPLLGLSGVLTSLPVLVFLVLVNLVVLPLATYLDAWHLLTTTDWDGGPPFWATLAIIPVANVVSSLTYLYSRRTATPL